MNQLRYLLYSDSGPGAAARVSEQLARLEETYLKARKRKLPFDIFISTWGDIKRPDVGLTAYYTPEQRSEVEFLLNSLSQ